MKKTDFDICLCLSFSFLGDLNALYTKIRAVWMYKGVEIIEGAVCLDHVH